MSQLTPLRQLPVQSLKAAERFPAVLLAGALVTFAIVSNVDGVDSERLLITSLLGVALSLALTLIVERFGLSWPARSILAAVVTAAVLWLFWISIELIPMESVQRGVPQSRLDETTPFRFFALAVAFHSLVAVVAWIGRGTVDQFWDFNRRLLLRILASLFFTGVLYGGLALAMWAVDELLGADVREDAYADLFGVLIGVVNTWFFLVGVPARDAARTAQESGAMVTADAARETSDGAFLGPAESSLSYPRSLKVFAQFVLIPLTAIYVVILYLYLGRIIIDWELPRGQVSVLVFSYAALGLLAYLLVYPLRNDEANRWIRTFARGFFFALPPLIMLLGVAIMRRTGEYGMTEPRLFGLVLGAWLAGITVWFLLRREDIRIIPASLAAVAILSVVGPWNVTSIAVASQYRQLERRLAALGADRAERSASDEPGEAERSVGTIVEFLHGRGALGRAASLVTRRPDTVSSVDEFMHLAGMDGWYDHARQVGGRPSSWHFDIGKPIALGGFSGMLPVNPQTDVQLSDGTRVRWWPADGTLRLETAATTLRLSLDSVLTAFEGRARTDPKARVAPGPDPPVIEARSRGVHARLVIMAIAGTSGANADGVDNFDGFLLYSIVDDTLSAEPLPLRR